METEKGNSKWKVQTMNDLHGTAYYTNSSREESHQDINRVLDEYKDIIKDLDAESVSIQMIAKNSEGQVVLERLNMREDRNIFVVNGNGIRIDAPTHLDAVTKPLRLLRDRIALGREKDVGDILKLKQYARFLNSCEQSRMWSVCRAHRGSKVF